MTIQVIDCSTLSFNTTNVYNISNDTIVGLSLEYSKNCASATTVDLLADVDDIVSSGDTESEGTTFLLTAEQLGLDTFCEGVYFFQWMLTYVVDEVQHVSTTSLCYLLDCEDKIKCKIADNFINNGNNEAILLYNALQFVNDCDTCSCSEACKIYKKLSNLLNLNTNGIHEDCSVC